MARLSAFNVWQGNHFGRSIVGSAINVSLEVISEFLARFGFLSSNIPFLATAPGYGIVVSSHFWVCTRFSL